MSHNGQQARILYVVVAGCQLFADAGIGFAADQVQLSVHVHAWAAQSPSWRYVCGAVSVETHSGLLML
jgi:hypothetical protein